MLAYFPLTLGICASGIGIYTIIAFLRFQRNAVFLGKAMVAINIFFSVISYALNSGYIITALLWVLWFLYLTYSEQVNDIFPKGFRKTLKKDIFIVAGSILLPAMFYIIGLTIYTLSPVVIQETTFTQGEKIIEATDERISVTIPESYSCKRIKYDNFVINQLVNNEDETKVTIAVSVSSVSGVENTTPNFWAYRDSWQDPNYSDVECKTISDKKMIIQNNYCHFKSVQYETDPKVIWEFAMLFDENTDKACVISCWLVEGEKSPILEILESVKFKE